MKARGTRQTAGALGSAVYLPFDVMEALVVRRVAGSEPQLVGKKRRALRPSRLQGENSKDREVGEVAIGPLENGTYFGPSTAFAECDVRRIDVYGKEARLYEFENETFAL